MQAANNEKRVVCPTCSGVSVYGPSNAFRPFCSERCKGIDLGAWASESFKMPVEAPLDDLQSCGRGKDDLLQ